MVSVENPCIYSEARLLSGETVTLGPCRTVLELKVRACQHFSIANFILYLFLSVRNSRLRTFTVKVSPRNNDFLIFDAGN